MNNLVTRAREFAIKYHGDQKYGDKPYVYHLDCVFNKLECVFQVDGESFQYTPNYGAVAYLHDILEDTDCEYEDLEKNFGYVVADNVLRLTKDKQIDYQDYITIVKGSLLSHAVKIADTRANLTQSVLDNDKGRIVKYAKQLVLLES